MMWRTRSANISAPPPGSESTPEAFSCSSVSRIESLARFDKIRDLDHGEGLEMHLRKALLQAGAEIEKILKRQVGMQSADDVKLGDGLAVSGSRGFEGLFERHGVGAGRIFLAAKGAQAASGDANIGGIDMAIDVEISLVAMHALADVVRHPADGKNVAGAVESEGVGLVQALAGHALWRGSARGADRRSEMVCITDISLMIPHVVCSLTMLRLSRGNP